MTTADESRDHLIDIVKSFNTAMFITMEADGTAHARPMSIARVGPGNELFLVTSVKSPKIANIVSQPLVTLTMQGTALFVALSGNATIVYERSTIEELWSEAWRAWFPDGKTDPDICLIRIDLEKGEYWDMSGTRGIAFMLEAAKSFAPGRKVESNESQNAKVALSI